MHVRRSLVVSAAAVLGAAAACSDSSSNGTSGASGSGGSSSGSGSGVSGSSGMSGTATGSSGATTGSVTDAGSVTDTGTDGSTTACPWRSRWVTKTVATPFAAPNASLVFTVPSIPCTLFKITDYGAQKGTDAGAGTNTQAFAQAVAAAKVNGGVVDVPPGTWLTGPIQLASHVELHIEAGATILFDANPSEYLPPVLTRWEGLDVKNFSPFVYVANATDVAITGPGLDAPMPGVLDGQGGATLAASTVTVADAGKDAASTVTVADAGKDAASTLTVADAGPDAASTATVADAGQDAGASSDAAAASDAAVVANTWWNWKGTATTEDERIYAYYLDKLVNGALPTPIPDAPTSAVIGGLRPTMVECNTCTNFLVDGITTQNAPYWTVHPLYSTNVIIQNSNITSNPGGSNGDGVDPDSCKNVLIDNVKFATSDDIISIKSGLNEDGIAVGKASEEIVIRNIQASLGHAISMGSEMSGGINNVFVTADTTNTLGGMQYLLRIKTLPGRGGTVQNIWFENVTGTGLTKSGIEFTTAYATPTIPTTFTSNGTAYHYNAALVPHLQNVTVKNVNGMSVALAADFAGLSAAPLTNLTFDTVTLSGSQPATCTLVTGLSLTNSTITGLTGTSCP